MLICICESCWLADLVFKNAEDDCDEDAVCWLNGEVEDGCLFWSSSFSGG